MQIIICHRFIKYCITNESFCDGFGSFANLFQTPKEADKSLGEKLAKLSLDGNTSSEKESDLSGADHEEMPWRPSDE